MGICLICLVKHQFTYIHMHCKRLSKQCLCCCAPKPMIYRSTWHIYQMFRLKNIFQHAMGIMAGWTHRGCQGCQGPLIVRLSPEGKQTQQACWRQQVPASESISTRPAQTCPLRFSWLGVSFQCGGQLDLILGRSCRVATKVYQASGLWQSLGWSFHRLRPARPRPRVP